MKYNDLTDVESEINKNEYVTYDVKPGKKSTAAFKRFNKIKLPENKRDLLILPLFALTAVSLGFLIAQVAQLLSSSSVNAILSFVL